MNHLVSTFAQRCDCGGKHDLRLARTSDVE
jgi:hypothetical protein